MNDDPEAYTQLPDAEVKDKAWFPNLTMKQRLIGMFVCALLGFIINVLSFVVLFAGSGERKVVAYAILFTYGNLVAILGTGFLWGFRAQYRSMTHKHRIAISSLYFGSMILTIIVVFTLEDPMRKVLLVLLILVQYFSYFWYALSYVPYARTAFRAFFRAIIG